MQASLPQVRNTSVAQESESGQTQLEDFVDTIAHELTEPLRTIGMFSELLVLEANLDEQSKRHARLIIDSVRRMSSMLEGLYEFALSGREDVDPSLDLAVVVNEAILNLEHAIGVSHAVVNVGSLPLVVGNGKQLLRILQNLIANGIKYRSDVPAEITITAEPRGFEWVIRICDNGIGIAPEYQEQIFHLFSRLHGRSIPGAGIGLAICRKLIETMGGTIWVESKVGSGSAFCFTLAAAQPAAEGLRRAMAAGQQSLAG